MRKSIAWFRNPWSYRRVKREQRVAELRQRDGDNCRRCRRPIRFDFPLGHDQGARIEQIRPGPSGDKALGNLCLTHGRCNAKPADHTGEVRERLRPKREAELFSKARKKRTDAA